MEQVAQDEHQSSVSTKKKPRKTKRERFVQVAQRRTVGVLRQLQLLAKCGNRSSYRYTDDDVAKIFSVIDEEIRRTKNAFAEDRGISFLLDEEDVDDDVNPDSIEDEGG